jgi:hypothetical protein
MIALLITQLGCSLVDSETGQAMIISTKQGEAVRWHGDLTPSYDHVLFLEERRGLPFFGALRGDRRYRALFAVDGQHHVLFFTLDDLGEPWIGYGQTDYQASHWGGAIELPDGQFNYFLADSFGKVLDEKVGPPVEHELEPTHLFFIQGKPVLLRLNHDNRGMFNLWGHESL